MDYYHYLGAVTSRASSSDSQVG